MAEKGKNDEIFQINQNSTKDPKLSEIFDDIWSTYQNLEQSIEQTNSDNIQLSIARVTKKCEAAIDMVNILSLFSTNEEIDEVATNEIRYMLLSALLGYFTMKRSSTAATRLGIVNKSKAYYMDYMRLCRLYGLTDCCVHDNHDTDEVTVTTTPTPTERAADMQSMVNTRAEKIKQFKQDQEDESKLRDLHTAVNREHVDDEVKREYYLALVKKFIRTGIDDLDCIKTEIEMLRYMEQRTTQPQAAKDKVQKPVTRPFILTKNELQKRVFGAGYPSIATMTIEEFYQQKVAEGTFQPTPSGSMQDWAEDPARAKVNQEREESVKEAKEDREDEESLMKARAWDDWKDENRRGDGNRQNMG